jgi:hypothetical protein
VRAHRRLVPVTELASLSIDQPWRQHAACGPAEARTFDIDAASDFTADRLADVQRICSGCLVMADCARWATTDRWTGYAAGQAWFIGTTEQPRSPYVTGKSSDLMDFRPRSTTTGAAMTSKPTKTTAAPKPRKPTKPTATATCRCGCGQEVRNLFAQGHDARYAGALIRSVRAGETTPAKAIAQARKVSQGVAAKVERGVKR